MQYLTRDASMEKTFVDKIRNMAEDSDFFLNSFTTHSVNQLVKYLVSQLPNSENTTGMSGTLSSNTTEIV